jgi:hypothetical protein
MSLRQGHKVARPPKAIPKNPRFDHVKSSIDTGFSMTKFLEKHDAAKLNVRFRREEHFRRVRPRSVAGMVEWAEGGGGDGDGDDFDGSVRALIVTWAPLCGAREVLCFIYFVWSVVAAGALQPRVDFWLVMRHSSFFFFFFFFFFFLLCFGLVFFFCWGGGGVGGGSPGGGFLCFDATFALFFFFFFFFFLDCAFSS